MTTKVKVNYPKSFERFFENLAKVFDGLIILRGYEQLPYGYQNDVDVFVPINDLPKFLSALCIISTPKATLSIKVCRPGLVKTELQIEKDVIPLDIIYDFQYFGVRYQDLPSLIANSVEHESGLFRIPCMSDELRISLLKELLHNKRVRHDKVSLLLQHWNMPGCCPSSKTLSLKTCKYLKRKIEAGQRSFPFVGRYLALRSFCQCICDSPFTTIEKMIFFILVKYFLGDGMLRSRMFRWFNRKNICDNWDCICHLNTLAPIQA